MFERVCKRNKSEALWIILCRVAPGFLDQALNQLGCLEKLHACLMMMTMNCFCGMVDLRKVFSLISSRDHCQRSSPSWISDTPRAGFEPVQKLSSGLVEWSCAVVISTTPRRHWVKYIALLTEIYSHTIWLIFFLLLCFAFILIAKRLVE